MVPLRLVEHLWMEPAADGLTAPRPAPPPQPCAAESNLF